MARLNVDEPRLAKNRERQQRTRLFVLCTSFWGCHEVQAIVFFCTYFDFRRDLIEGIMKTRLSTQNDIITAGTNSPKALRTLVLAVIGMAITFAVPGAAQAQLYSASQEDANLRIVSEIDGSTVQTIPLTGPAADRVSGFAVSPVDGIAYAIARGEGAVGRDLITIDLQSGTTATVGNTGVAMAGLTFAPDGTLYGVSGDGGPVPNEALFTISTIDGSATLIGEMGAGGDGEAIGYNPDDGLIYHFSGLRETDPIGREIYESINPSDATTNTTILPEGTPDAEEGLALLYRGDGEFYASFLREDSDPTVGENQFATIDTEGNVTTLGHFDHRSKGLAFVPEPSTLFSALLAGLALIGLRKRLFA